MSPPTGQWFDATDGQRWWFDSGSIAFDLAYTGGFGGPPEWERWHDPADAASWLSERLGVQVDVDETTYERARALRGAIARGIVAAAQGRPIPVTDASLVDAHAAMPDWPPQLLPGLTPTADRLLATLARDAVLSLADPDRVRTCAADDCGVMYLDTSRSGSRTWCSMRRCGNRHKVRQLRARRAARTTPTKKTAKKDEGELT
jgi:predicted RNA-binding Zn ribbon-like protein